MFEYLARFLIAALLAWILPETAQTQDQRDDNRILLVAAVANAMILDRPYQDALVSASDGTKYVQCRRMPNRAMHCESAGTLMQPSLARVLTQERIARLIALGWHLDPSFGNYVRTFPPDTSSVEVARSMVEVLEEAYGAELADASIESDWIRSDPCPPRAGPGQTRAGMITDSPKLAKTAIHACSLPPKLPVPARSGDDLFAIYGLRVIGELQRLQVNYGRSIYIMLDPGLGYVQCAAQSDPSKIYCEAQSADSWEGLRNVLTAERVTRLHAAGFSETGRSPNYWKVYEDQLPDVIAHEVLGVLHDVYGYDGSTRLRFKTEKSED